MEGSKNAMYAQAGRSRGWSQGTQPVVPVPTVPAAPVIPEPPVVVLPIRPVAEAPAADIPMMPVAEPSVIMMSAEAAVELETTAISMRIPEHMHHFKDCETPVMAYIPMQNWGGLYEPEQGFSRGTIFANLDLPWLGEGACRYE